MASYIQNSGLQVFRLAEPKFEATRCLEMAIKPFFMPNDPLVLGYDQSISGSGHVKGTAWRGWNANLWESTERGDEL